MLNMPKEIVVNKQSVALPVDVTDIPIKLKQSSKDIVTVHPEGKSATKHNESVSVNVTSNCVSCLDSINKQNSITCAHGHTTCIDDCLIRWVELHTFESIDKAASDFDFTRLQRNVSTYRLVFHLFILLFLLNQIKASNKLFFNDSVFFFIIFHGKYNLFSKGKLYVLHVLQATTIPQNK
jgi:hypothetical protein